MSPNLKFQASQIRKSGDNINDAVNFWSEAPAILDTAYLPENCFGEIGEELGLRQEYEKSRAQTILKLNDDTITLIQNREAVYTTADRYEHAEVKSTHEVQKAGLSHRPEVGNERDDYESRYGWARDDS
ncbi:hypothetical protein GCM10023195_85090 [Actinoallomurus liliacearum]|uniref:Uncharacterized protein n=1 Tax=Actinoallomurus liliacearum TaxID=1080073 RepID=A0ABP8TXG9_9ACTN